MGSCHVDLHWRVELLWLEGLSFLWAGGCIATSSLEPESLSALAFHSTMADAMAWMECLDKVVFAAGILLDF